MHLQPGMQFTVRNATGIVYTLQSVQDDIWRIVWGTRSVDATLTGLLAWCKLVGMDTPNSNIDTAGISSKIETVLTDAGVENAIVLVGLPGEEDADPQEAAQAAQDALVASGFTLA